MALARLAPVRDRLDRIDRVEVGGNAVIVGRGALDAVVGGA